MLSLGKKLLPLFPRCGWTEYVLHFTVLMNVIRISRYSVRCYPWFNVTAVGLGTYYPWIRGPYCVCIYIVLRESQLSAVTALMALSYMWSQPSLSYFPRCTSD
jgi:hypothetical protein